MRLRRWIALGILLTLVLVYGISRRMPSSAEPESFTSSATNSTVESDYFDTELPDTPALEDAGSYVSFTGAEYRFSERAFLETFDGAPPRPLPWRPSSEWDVAIHSRDVETWRQLLPMEATTGPECEAGETHRVREYGDAVFQCDNRLLTAVNGASYSVAVLTPAVLTEFSADSSAKIRFDVSTKRLSPRDWIDVWITPFDDHLLYPLEPWQPDLTGQPRNAVHVRLDASTNSVWQVDIVRNFEAERLERTDIGWQGYETFVTPDDLSRETFEIELSRTHVRVGMPEYNFWWVDEEIDPPLPFDNGIVQFGHHSSSPGSDCEEEGSDACKPNTWQWDNMLIDPAIPFTMLPADARYVDATTDRTVFFNQPSPRSGIIRFAAIGLDIEVSFDGGESWVSAEKQAQANTGDEKFYSYFMPIPWGTESVTFRGENWWGGPWHVRDISVWRQP